MILAIRVKAKVEICDSVAQRLLQIKSITFISFQFYNFILCQIQRSAVLVVLSDELDGDNTISIQRYSRSDSVIHPLR
jgi:hypothetical protein